VGRLAAVEAGPWAAAPWQAQQTAAYSKPHKAKKGGAAASTAGSDAAAAATFDLTETKELMERALSHLQGELANIRTGRATPGMLDHLKVGAPVVACGSADRPRTAAAEGAPWRCAAARFSPACQSRTPTRQVDVYGERLPFKACGTVSVRDPQLLAVTVYDADAVPSVVKAVSESPLRLTPRAEGQEVLVPIPRPTTESIAAMVKVCRSEGEAAKVSLRHARKAAMDAAKRLPGEDERRRVEREVQRLTDQYVGQAEEMVEGKERSIASHDS
jgi:ribosome recycling factor